mmetsp:Transcript_64219/g.193856  ORF Transcript_64219/g.193856 Transcript_64219/m.193856 type:complete len:217 (-) Transcript_64219:2175-2825(-)
MSPIASSSRARVRSIWRCLVITRAASPGCRRTSAAPTAAAVCLAARRAAPSIASPASGHASHICRMCSPISASTPSGAGVAADGAARCSVPGLARRRRPRRAAWQAARPAGRSSAAEVAPGRPSCPSARAASRCAKSRYRRMVSLWSCIHGWTHVTLAETALRKRSSVAGAARRGSLEGSRSEYRPQALPRAGTDRCASWTISARAWAVTSSSRAS